MLITKFDMKKASTASHKTIDTFQKFLDYHWLKKGVMQVSVMQWSEKAKKEVEFRRFASMYDIDECIETVKNSNAKNKSAYLQILHQTKMFFEKRR